jgi:hypothetical protein
MANEPVYESNDDKEIHYSARGILIYVELNQLLMTDKNNWNSRQRMELFNMSTENGLGKAS